MTGVVNVLASQQCARIVCQSRSGNCAVNHSLAESGLSPFPWIGLVHSAGFKDVHVSNPARLQSHFIRGPKFARGIPKCVYIRLNLLTECLLLQRHPRALTQRQRSLLR